MNTLKMLALVLCTVTAMNNVYAGLAENEGVQTIIYRGRPVHIEIPIGSERLIEFQGMAMKVFVPDDLIEDIAVESWPGSVFITSEKGFKSRRFRASSVATNEVFFIDVTAREGAPTVPVRILSPDQASEITSKIDDQVEAELKIAPVSVVGLTRYAFQQLYSPERLLTSIDGLYPYRIEDDAEIRTLVPGVDLLAKPVAAWRTANGLFATAIYMENYESQVIELDPRVLRAGEGWVSASFWDGVLTPVGSSGSTTSLVVVTDRPWTGRAVWR